MGVLKARKPSIQKKSANPKARVSGGIKKGNGKNSVKDTFQKITDFTQKYSIGNVLGTAGVRYLAGDDVAAKYQNLGMSPSKVKSMLTKHRSPSPTNVKALRRSVSRLSKFEKLSKKITKSLNKLAHKQGHTAPRYAFRRRRR